MLPNSAIGTVRDDWGNEILEVVEETFPILDDYDVKLSFSYAVIKVYGIGNSKPEKFFCATLLQTALAACFLVLQES